MRRSGKIKWFNRELGYGFIGGATESEKDVFIHIRDVRRSGFETLMPDESVSFETEEQPRGLRAVNIQKDANV